MMGPASRVAVLAVGAGIALVAVGSFAVQCLSRGAQVRVEGGSSGRPTFNGIFSFGSPAFSSPGYKYTAPCNKRGLRVVNGKDPGPAQWSKEICGHAHDLCKNFAWLSEGFCDTWVECQSFPFSQMDGVSILPRYAGYRHSNMASVIVNAGDDHDPKIKEYQCNESLDDLKGPIVPNNMLHETSSYEATARKLPTGTQSRMMAETFLQHIYNKSEDIDTLTESWRLIGSAQPSDTIAHLFQRTESYDCVLTFQGSSDISHWQKNAQTQPVHFCGLVSETQTCTRAEAIQPFDINNFTNISVPVCEVETEGEVFVHEGMKAMLLELVQTEDWKQTIRSKLPYCKSVSGLGHSLGGALLEMYAACLEHFEHESYDTEDVNKPFGYTDYEYLNWSSEEPELCDEYVKVQLHAEPVAVV